MRLRGRAAAGSEITDVVALLRTRFPKGRLVRKPAERMEYKDRKDKKKSLSAVKSGGKALFIAGNFVFRRFEKKKTRIFEGRSRLSKENLFYPFTLYELHDIL